MRYGFNDTLPPYVPKRKYSNTPTNEYECKQARWLTPDEYIANGYKPLSAFRCLRELRERCVLHGVNDDGVFWYQVEDSSLSPGIHASIAFHLEALAGIYENNRDTGTEPIQNP